MTLLILGVLLFAGVHFIPSLAPGLKANWVGRMGENGYKGIFSLLLLGAFALMITGWRGAQPTYLYMPSPELRHLAMLLLLLAFLLMVVSSRKSRQIIRRQNYAAWRTGTSPSRSTGCRCAIPAPFHRRSC